MLALLPVSAIYLLRASPHVSSVLPSIASAGAESGGQPSHGDGLHELAASRWNSPAITRRLVVSYTTFSPLPNLQLGGCFLLPYPAVANCFYFRKWSALCCPDFPPASPLQDRPAADRGSTFPTAKVSIFAEMWKLFHLFLAVPMFLLNFAAIKNKTPPKK